MFIDRKSIEIIVNEDPYEYLRQLEARIGITIDQEPELLEDGSR